MTDAGHRAAVLFDVDGTLVDSNYLHVVAWWRAFRAHGHRVEMAAIHRTVGQGSERLVETLLGRPDDDVAAAHSDFYGPSLHALTAFDGAADLLRATSQRGLAVVLATSASEKEVTHLRRVIDADDAIDAVTHKGDVDRSKPDPQIVQKALGAVGVPAERAMFVGDTVWDVAAARAAGVECVCVRSGGIGTAELRAAGAVAVYDDVAELLSRFDSSPVGALVDPTRNA